MLKHRMSTTSEYLAWRNLRYRCTKQWHPAWKNYGGRGITVCAEWDTTDGGFESFYEHIGPKPHGYTLDRIDNAKGYEPGNVRWTPWKEQIRNRRVARLITAQGMTRNQSAWAEETGLSEQVIYHRLKAGWEPNWALAVPTRR